MYVLWPANQSFNNDFKFSGEHLDPIPDYSEIRNIMRSLFISIMILKKLYNGNLLQKSKNKLDMWLLELGKLEISSKKLL